MLISLGMSVCETVIAIKSRWAMIIVVFWKDTHGLGACAKFRKAAISFTLFVCPSAWIISAVTGRIFIKNDIWIFFEKLSRRHKFL
jgi:hypothetical protein